MSTDSDSDEQFESADEDLDLEVEEKSDVVPQACKDKDEVCEKFSNLNVQEIPKLLHHVTTSRTEPLGKSTENINSDVESNIKGTLSKRKVIERENKFDSKNPNTKASLPVQTLVTSVPHVIERETKSVAEQEKSNKDVKVDTLHSVFSKEEDAEMKSSDCDGWDLDNISSSESKLGGSTIDNSPNISKPFSNIVNPSKIGDTVTSKQDVQNKDFVCQKGIDGWDVEFEDGFEIPVDLNKGTTPSTVERFPFSLTSPLQKLTNNKPDTWGSWGAWGGVGNILSSATTGVTSLTSQVSQGFSQVIGAPDPTELARLDEDTQLSPDKNEDNRDSGISRPTSEDTSGTALFSLSQLTRLVETTGSKVISGGLDTLENLGKKTMEVLQDGDPGLKKKRAILFPQQDKPVLSQVLRDAKGRRESESSSPGAQETVTSKSSSSCKKSAKNLHFESLLDDYQGLAHLEALEILSKQCSVKLHNALLAKSGDERQSQEVNEFQETLQQIREMCQVEDATDPTDSNDEDEMGFDEKIEEIVRLYDLTSKLNTDKLLQVNRKITLQVDRLPLQSSCDEIYSQCLHSMAEFTSVAMDVFHKSANLLLLKAKHRTVDETDALTQFTYVLCSRITQLSSVFCQAMMMLDKDTGLVTNVYLEAANSCSYLQDASQLVIPILQIVAIPGAS